MASQGGVIIHSNRVCSTFGGNLLFDGPARGRTIFKFGRPGNCKFTSPTGIGLFEESPELGNDESFPDRLPNHQSFPRVRSYMASYPRGPCLKVIRGNMRQKQIPIPTHTIMIGRSNDNHLCLPDPGVSRRHACLRYAQGAWFIQDQNNTSGTFINGQSIIAARLNPGDEIIIGKNKFRFQA